jgi:hypothetical protein
MSRGVAGGFSGNAVPAPMKPTHNMVAAQCTADNRPAPHSRRHTTERPTMNHATVRRPIEMQGFVLRFPSLFDDGRGYAFPCDVRGEVNLQALSPRARDNYLAARSRVGRDFGQPAVLAEERWH